MPTNTRVEIEELRTTLENLKPQVDACYAFAIYTQDTSKAKEMLKAVTGIEALLSEVNELLSLSCVIEGQLQKKLLEIRESDIFHLVEDLQI